MMGLRMDRIRSSQALGSLGRLYRCILGNVHYHVSVHYLGDLGSRHDRLAIIRRKEIRYDYRAMRAYFSI
jgi:hypothetical protein